MDSRLLFAWAWRSLIGLRSQEFIPQGRQAVVEHPGPLITKKPLNLSTEPMLLYRLQNVNISSDDSAANEFWHLREILHENVSGKSGSLNDAHIVDPIVNTEEELYVKGTTAVWSKGINDSQQSVRLPVICFTCETRIKFAFFCPPDFYSNENENENLARATAPIPLRAHGDVEETGVCLVDGTSIRVYTPMGEDFRTSLEFPVSSVWQTMHGLLLERNESTAVVGQETVTMPRLYSFSHPLNELCPVLLKSSNGMINILTESDYRIVFASVENDLVMFYDRRLNRHFLARLRIATAEEKQAIGGREDIRQITHQMNDTTKSIPQKLRKQRTCWPALSTTPAAMKSTAS